MDSPPVAPQHAADSCPYVQRSVLLECREDPVFRDKGVWRKTALFDRFLTLDTKLPRTDGTRALTEG